MWPVSEFGKKTKIFGFYFFFCLFFSSTVKKKETLTSATMRAVDWRRAAAVVLCLFGCLVSGADAKTSAEGSAAEGKRVRQRLDGSCVTTS